MLTGRESKWGTSLLPVSISCQVCFPDIDYIQGRTLGKIESHRSVGLSLPNEKDNKVLCFVGKTNADTNLKLTF
ncbi:Bardet-Biedl syndrome 4 protein-like protein [Bienertia sinuspersici]